MPTYRNDTENRITFSDKHYISWQPGEAKALPYFVPWKTLGLTQASPEPLVNRQDGGYWELIIKPGVRQVVDLLPYLHTFQLSIFVLKGLVKMWVGDDPTPIIVDPQNTHLSRRAWDMTAYLTFEAVATERCVSGDADTIGISGTPSGDANLIMKMEAIA